MTSQQISVVKFASKSGEVLEVLTKLPVSENFIDSEGYQYR